MRHPLVARDPVALPAWDDREVRLWTSLAELTEIEAASWTLVGGQMVLLHALENNSTPPRVSTDIDVLVNARVASAGVRAFADALTTLGFALDGVSPEGLGHRFRRDQVSVDVLAPEGLGPRTDLTTTPPARTLQVSGGTQALDRTELLPVTIAGRTCLVPRPSLLGAIVMKAVAVDLDDLPGAQLLDLALLLSLVTDPFELRGTMTAKDLARLRRRSEMFDRDQAAWMALPPERAVRGRAAHRVLSS